MRKAGEMLQSELAQRLLRGAAVGGLIAVPSALALQAVDEEEYLPHAALGLGIGGVALGGIDAAFNSPSDPGFRRRSIEAGATGAVMGAATLLFDHFMQQGATPEQAKVLAMEEVARNPSIIEGAN